MSRNNGDKARFGKDRKKRIQRRVEIRDLRKTLKPSGEGQQNDQSSNAQTSEDQHIKVKAGKPSAA